MLKYISLIILYILVVSSFFSLVIYEESGTEINNPIGNIYSGGSVDFSGKLNLKDIVDNSYNNMGWNIVNNTLIRTNGIYDPYAKGLFFKGFIPDENNNINVKIVIDNKDNADFNLYVTSNKKSINPISTKKYYVITYRDNKISMKYPDILGLGENVFSQNINLSGKHTIEYKISNTQKTLDLTIDEALIGSYVLDLEKTYDYYLGVGVFDEGEFIIESIDALILITDINETSFTTIIASLLLWNVDEKYLPMAFNILLIKFPLIILTIAVAFYIRGVS
jgi:hypothetical protein